MTSEFSIPIHDLDAAGKPFAFRVRGAWLRSALEECDAAPTDKEGSLEVRVSKSGNDVVVHGHLAAEMTVPCARCLEPAKVVIDVPVSVLMVPAHAVRAPKDDDEQEIAAEEPDVLPYSGDEIVLDELVRDEILLEIPMIPLCSEDCPGMSPPPAIDSSAHADVDPRLLPLLELKKKSEANKKKE
jgi:uncharacterized protein